MARSTMIHYHSALTTIHTPKSPIEKAASKMETAFCYSLDFAEASVSTYLMVSAVAQLVK